MIQISDAISVSKIKTCVNKQYSRVYSFRGIDKNY